jgi:hypothetical protein
LEVTEWAPGPRLDLRWLGQMGANGERIMRSAHDCYVHAAECERLAEIALSDLDRDRLWDMAARWQRLAEKVQEKAEAKLPRPNLH